MSESLLEPASTDALSTGTKRKQSEEPEQQEIKRARVSPSKEEPAPDSTTNRNGEQSGQESLAPTIQKPEDKQGNEAARRKPGTIEEKQRSRRLFGSLLGTLGQRNDKTAKKRQEIEQRTKAELQQQDDALLEDRSARQRRLKERRKKEQWDVDEADMRIRHRSMRHTANFLETRALPKLYYRPWELRPEDQRAIDEQKRVVEGRIDDEVDAFEKRRHSNHARRPSTDSSPKSVDGTTADNDKHLAVETKNTTEPAALPEEVSDGANAQPQDTQQDTTLEAPTQSVKDDTDKQPLPPEETVDQQEVKAVEQEDEHMVEGDEDNVIY